jgi:hypothetical protein
MRPFVPFWSAKTARMRPFVPFWSGFGGITFASWHRAVLIIDPATEASSAS